MADEHTPKQDEAKEQVQKPEPKADPKPHQKPDVKLEKKIASISSEIASSVEDELPEFEDVDEESSLIDTLRHVFQATGIRKGSVIGCGVVLLIVLGVGLFFSLGGWDRVKTLLPFGRESTVTTPPTTLRPTETTTADINAAYLFGFYPTRHISYAPSFETSYMFGGLLPTKFFVVRSENSGLNTAYRFGFRGQMYDRIEVYIDTIRQIQSALNTDIHGVLDSNADRRASLDQLIRDFDELYGRAQELGGLAAKEVITLQTQTTPIRDRRLALERDFNANLAVFLPRESRRALEEYIQISKEEVELRAQLGAVTKIDRYYQVALVKLAARIRDIKANYEALAKGVKVFDILNSDIDIIKYEGSPPRDTGIAPLTRTPSSGYFTPVDFATGIH